MRGLTPIILITTVKQKKLPLWCKKAKKRLIDKEMTQVQLAKILKVNPKQLNQELNGTVINTTIQASVCQYLDI